MKLVSVLKEGVASSSLAANVIKTEQAEDVFVVHVKGHFLMNIKNIHVSTSASTSSPVYTSSSEYM